jgi:hypothetical protein
MGFIFIAEIFQGGEHRVWSRLSQSTKRAVFDGMCQLFQHSISPSRPSPCVMRVRISSIRLVPIGRRYICRRILLGKIQEEPCHIHHAGGLVHYYHTSRTHDGTGGVYTVVIDYGMREIFGNTTTGRSAQLYGLKFFTIRLYHRPVCR